jgi:hypothetical protein
MQILKLSLIMLLLCLGTVRAQIGWTLAQCRKHFGHEIGEADSRGVHTFGIKYRYYTPKENVEERDAPAFSFDGILVGVTLDSDGTVGSVRFHRSGSFSNQEIKELLKRSSAVSWSPAPFSPMSDWFREEGQRPIEWVGEHNGAILFDAVEDFDLFDGGHDYLTVTTRQLY